MKLYKCTLKPLSSISKMPDAQTIFGAICSVIRFTKGEEELQRYLTSFDEQPLFIHSSMFIEGLLPMAKVGLISIKEKNKNVFSLSPCEQLQYTTELKRYKGLKSISLEVFREYILDGAFDDLRQAIDDGRITTVDDIVTEELKAPSASQMLVHNNKAINAREDNERGLYYDRNLYLRTNTCIYVKTNNIEYVKSIFKYFPYFGIGNRVSVGKNCFELVDVIELPAFKHKTAYRMLLSKCISDEFDLSESNYMIDSSVYRGSKYYSANKIGRINKFVEGSYMKIYDEQEYYGHIVRVENDRPIYHYGIGFVL